MSEQKLTIGKLAQAAGVGVETIRYYQRRNLLPVPPTGEGAYRSYSPDTVGRLRFIKRAQQLGFSLEEIATLLKLEDEQNRTAIRDVAARKLARIRENIAALQRMEAVLAQLVCECETSSKMLPCPIIAALAQEGDNQKLP